MLNVFENYHKLALEKHNSKRDLHRNTQQLQLDVELCSDASVSTVTVLFEMSLNLSLGVRAISGRD